MSRWVRRALKAAVALPALAAILIISCIGFDSPPAPHVIPGGGVIAGQAEWNAAEIPAVQKIVARDGAPLLYRAYPGRPDRFVILVHGSTGTSLDMHKVALALQAAGATAYTVSLRGHGGSGTTIGDVSYVGQLDDDLADMMKALALDKPGIKRTLIGYSAGGGFALRTASGPQRALFDGYIVIAPYVAAYADIRRRHLGYWANAATLRIAGLYLLDEIGVHWLQDLPVVRYAVDPTPSDKRTPAYTYRMLRSLHMGFDWKSAMARIQAPTFVLTSDADELSNSSRYRMATNPRIQVKRLPDFEHDELVTRPESLAVIVSTWQGLVGP